jgi:DnaK suppressor protein
MTKQELASFKKLLQQRRAILAGDVNHLEEGALRKTKDDAATLDISNFADLGTDNFEQDFMIGLIENSEETLREIDAALQRIDDGNFGVCEEGGHPVGKNRLKVIPWARLCIECQRKAEIETKGQ